MQRHGPKRIYTPQSLEFWFGKLEREWTGNFSVPQLEEGRRMYRDSEIREVELTARDAIIHRKVEKKEEYAVIEWDAGRLLRALVLHGCRTRPGHRRGRPARN